MNIIKHRMIPYAYHENIFDNIETFEELMNKIQIEGKTIEELTKRYFSNIILDNKKINDLLQKRYNETVGDLFEIFSIAYLNYFGSSYDIHDVKLSSELTNDGDYGVDAYGFDSRDGKRVSIQMKFRSNEKFEFTYSDMSTFVTASHYPSDQDFSIDDFTHMILITTGSGINHVAKKRLSLNGKFRVINHKNITNDIKNNISFWRYLKDVVKKSYEFLNLNENKKPLVLRDYQSDLVNKFSNIINSTDNFKQQFILPTAAGKSIIQASLINSLIEKSCKIFLTVAPTIVLVNQLGNVYEKNIDKFVSSHIVSSEGVKNDIGVQLIENSTDLYIIMEKIIEAEILNIPIIFSSTYKSFSKVFQAVEKLGKKIDVCFMDEAQHAVKSDNFEVIVNSLDNNLVTNLLSFTATPKNHPADDSNKNNNNIASMENISVFGEKYVVTVKDLTEKGYLSKVSMTFVETNNKFIPKDIKKNICNIIDNYSCELSNGITDDVIKYSYDELMSIVFSIENHIMNIRKYKNKNIKGKLIISCSSVARAHLLAKCLNDIITIIDSDIFNEEWFIDAISSDNNLMKKFTETGDRDLSLKMFKEKDKNSILCHYNVLSEGIDVPDCTAVIMLRGMNEILVCQTIGRTIRRTSNDIIFHNSIYNTENYKSRYVDNAFAWEKPYGHVIIPIFGDNQNIKYIVDDILSKIFSGNIDYVIGEIDFVTAGNTDEEDESSRLTLTNIKKIVDEEFEKIKAIFNYDEEIIFYNYKEEIKNTIEQSDKKILDILKML